MGPQLSFGSPRVKWFLLSSAGILLVCWIGDHFLNKWDKLCDLFTHVILARIISRALVDTTIHATIAGWSWLNVWLLQAEEGWSPSKLWQALACGLLASLVDIDHFLEAKSWYLEDALHLHSRPFLHNTTLILALTAIIFILVYSVSHFKATVLYDLPAMFFIACVSHHFRDACRRGLWLAPLGSLPPHRVAYVLGIVALPVMVVALRRWTLFASHRGLVAVRTPSRCGRVSPV